MLNCSDINANVYNVIIYLMADLQCCCMYILCEFYLEKDVLIFMCLETECSIRFRHQSEWQKRPDRSYVILRSIILPERKLRNN
jgi:hypothetical protein